MAGQNVYCVNYLCIIFYADMLGSNVCCILDSSHPGSTHTTCGSELFYHGWGFPMGIPKNGHLSLWVPILVPYKQLREIFRGIPTNLGFIVSVSAIQAIYGNEHMEAKPCFYSLPPTFVTPRYCSEHLHGSQTTVSHSVQCHLLTATGPHNNTCIYCMAIRLACVSHILVHKEPG